jgi:TonB-linked SusC/RagA family outer membrane protein
LLYSKFTYMNKRLLLLQLVFFLSIATAFAQERIVTGTVTTADSGEPLPGVTVNIKGTTTGTVTDADGKFRVGVKPGAVLRFTFIGFAPQEIAVAAGVNSYAVKLQTDTHLLNDVIVTDGYAVQLKKAYTGAATAISGEQNENKPFTSTMQSLQGEVAGLNISNSSGQPGANVEVRLRGVGSIGAGSNPLYVIDGTIINAGDLSTMTTTANVLAGVNNDDIASISVLKDASATAIYGSRGSNGVIVITTKKGRAGKTEVEGDVEAGSTSDLPLPAAGEPLTPAQFRALTLEGLKNAGYDQGTIDYYTKLYQGPSNNWYDLVTRDGSQQQYNVSVRGGDDKTKIFASGGYFRQNATTIASSLDRITGLINLDHSISKRFSISLGANISNVNQYTPDNGGAFANPIGSAYFLTPFQTAYNKDGSINISQDSYPSGVSNYNPIYIAANDKHFLSQTRLLGNLSIKWNIIGSLKFTSYVGLDDNILEENQYLNPVMGDGAPAGSGSDNYTRYFNYLVRNQFDYRYNILKNSEDFYIDLTAGYEAQRSAAYFIQSNSTGYPATQPSLTVSANASTPIVGNASFNDYTYDSFYSRGSINFKNLYTLSASFRRDGSSVFGRNNPYGNFYSVGGAWNLDQEAFFSKQKLFSSAKLRSSIGVTGNSQGLGSYSALPTAAYGNNYAGNTGQNFNTLGNPDLTWESSHKFDAGADFGFLKDRLTFTVDYYRNNIDGLIQSVPVSYVTGFSTVTANIGAMVNRGFEFDITGNPIKTPDFNWVTDFNIALNRNTVTKIYNGLPYDDGGFQTAVGKDLYTWRAPIYAGVNPANGEALWYTDATRSTKTDVYEDAQPVDGYQADPKAFGGFNNTFSYKGFTLAVDIYFNYGNYINDSWGGYFTDGLYNTEVNKYQYIYDHRWTHPGQITDVPQYVDGGTNNGEAGNYSTRFLYKGDYERLKNLTIGYNFTNQAFLKSIGISKLYLYGRGTNLFTHTYDSRLPFDPEVGILGASNLEVPQVRTFTIGLNVGL